MTTNLGLIQWIDPTQSLNSFIEKSLKDKKINDKIKDNFFNWISNGGDLVQAHGKGATRLSRDKVIAFYQNLVNKIPLDVMR